MDPQGSPEAPSWFPKPPAFLLKEKIRSSVKRTFDAPSPTSTNLQRVHSMVGMSFSTLIDSQSSSLSAMGGCSSHRLPRVLLLLFPLLLAEPCKCWAKSWLLRYPGYLFFFALLCFVLQKGVPRCFPPPSLDCTSFDALAIATAQILSRLPMSFTLLSVTFNSPSSL